MKTGLSIVLALSVLPAPGLALSCMRPDVARSFAQAEAAEEVYIVVHGGLYFDASRLPETDWDNQAATPPHTHIPARLAGDALSAQGFMVAFDEEITLDAQCFGPWCASLQPGARVLVFLERQTDGRYLAAIDPCYSLIFSEPSGAQLGQVESCMRGAGCEPAP